MADELSNALLSIQQTHREIADKLWDICFSYNLVNTPVKELIRHGWKPVYHFKTFTMPYFTRLFNAWSVPGFQAQLCIRQSYRMADELTLILMENA